MIRFVDGFFDLARVDNGLEYKKKEKSYHFLDYSKNSIIRRFLIIGFLVFFSVCLIIVFLIRISQKVM